MTANSQPADPTPHDDRDIVVVVDLDETLCRTDTLHEALLTLVSEKPLLLVRLPGWVAKGRSHFKEQIADHAVIDPAELPLNEAVLKIVRTAREEGRRTALVSASDHRQVTVIAQATGLFDEAYGSADGRNLKGAAKSAFLTEHFGAKMFDYIGDSRADLPVWAAARKAITVRARPSLRQAAEDANANVLHIDPPASRARSMLKAMRPHQWAKNVLLFLPVLAAHDLTKLAPVFLGFLAFCLTASAVYVMNDLLDLAADRAHPRKRKRPFAAGELSAVTGGIMAAGLLTIALILGLLTGNLPFLGVLGAYLVATFAYSLLLKRQLLVDVLALAGLYTIRIVAGGTAAAVPLSPWLLGFSMFLFLALASVKRQAELTDQLKTGRASSGRAYQVDDLPILRGMGIAAANAAVMVLALYISSDNVQALYSKPQLIWLICPFLLYWILRMVMKTHRGEMTDDPVVFAATDRVSQIVVLSCVIVTLASI